MTFKRYDLRGQRSKVIKTKHVGGRVVERDPKAINAVTIHQMACEMGLTAARIKRAGGDASLAMAQRALGIACHAAAFRGGQSVLSAPARWYVQHGNAHNPTHLGLEIDGRHPGLDDDPSTTPIREDIKSTWGGPPTVYTALLIETACDALTWLVESAWAEGMPIEYIDAHRQSSGTRRSDPGERLWRDVVLGYAVPTLRLKTRPAVVWAASTKTAKPGRPIPIEWDRDGVGTY